MDEGGCRGNHALEVPGVEAPVAAEADEQPLDRLVEKIRRKEPSDFSTSH